MENQALYDQLVPLAEASKGDPCNKPEQRPWDLSPLQQQTVPEFICPSESLPAVKGIMDTWFGPEQAAIASYFGSAGPVSSGPPDWGVPYVCGNCVGGRLCPCIKGDKPGGNIRGFFHGQNPGGPGMLDMWANKLPTSKVPDGTSKTLHVGETYWTDPDSNQSGCYGNMHWMGTWAVATTVWGINTDYVARLGLSLSEHKTNNYLMGCNFRSRHPGGAFFLFADGSVTFLTDETNDGLLANLGDRNDGRVGDQYQSSSGGVVE